MAKTGPQKYPGASTSYWYGNKYPGSAMESNVVVWHSTEGRSLPSYGGGGSAPNFTAVPDFKNKRMRWYQHFDFDDSSRALMNLRGGVETNTLNASQVEVVGTCDSRHAKTWRLGSRTYRAGVDYLYMGDLPTWAIRDLAAFCKWTHDKHGVRLASGLTFKAYPSSYGSNGVRMSGAKWRGFYGHCGHQHVPENDHGDPGSFPMAAILSAAQGGSTQQEDDMQPNDKLTVSDWLKSEFPNEPGLQDGSILVETALVSGYGWSRIAATRTAQVLAQLGAQQATIDKLVDALGDAGGITAEQVKAAAEEGANAALDRLADALTTEG